jgi:hypothetical protein
LTFDFDVDNNAGTPASTGIFLTAFEFNMDLAGDGMREVARPHYVAWFNGPPGSLKTNAMAATNVFLADQFAELRLFGDVSPLGEDELPNDLVDAADLDALLAAVGEGNTDPLFDLNGDAVVSADDVTTLFGILDTQYGDANLDGHVDDLDLAIWQANYGTNVGWSGSNFDGDADVDGRDFLVWQRNFGFGADLAAIVNGVPEPAAMRLLLLAASILASRRAQGR